ncbi:hypothetical protein ACFO3D_18805 [Virgibacillus kekensis]|uniref:ABC transporter permease n=1 Tax=Virgibacillus kekensis TaxID=202261 RepID=A0ABV9DMU1_9BACI
MNKTADLHAFLFIRKARFHKKLKIYKQVAALVFDLTTAIYTVALLGYLGITMFVTGDIIQELEPYFSMVEKNASIGYSVLLSVLPIRYVFSSFRQPGLLFSTSEFQLGLLPFRRGKIWTFVLVEKMLRLLLTLGVIGTLLILVTPISGKLIISYLALFAIYELVMTVPQWKLYQQQFLIKAGWLLLFIVSCIAAALFGGGPILLVILILAHIVLIPRLFRGVKWDKVTDISNYQIWNMMVVSAASKTKFKKKKSYSIFRNSARRKRDFTTTDAIYHRLWQLYFNKNLGVIAQVIGAIMLMLVVFQFLEGWLYFVGMAIGIYIYSSLCANLFHNRFSMDVVEVLPWDLQRYKRIFFKWMTIGGGLVIIPVLVYFIINWNFWAPFQLLFVIAVLLYTYHVKMDKAVILLAKKPQFTQLREGLNVIFLALIVISYFQPVVSLAVIGVVMLLLKKPQVNLLN